MNKSQLVAMVKFDLMTKKQVKFAYLLLIVATLFLLNGRFIICIYKCMSTLVRVDGAAHFTFFLVIRLNITIVTSCDSLFVILLP